MILKDRAHEMAKNCKHDRYQIALANMAYKFFDKKTEVGKGVNEQLAEELHKSQVYARFKSNIWAADLAKMGWLASEKRNVKKIFIMCHRCFH